MSLPRRVVLRLLIALDHALTRQCRTRARQERLLPLPRQRTKLVGGTDSQPGTLQPSRLIGLLRCHRTVDVSRGTSLRLAEVLRHQLRGKVARVQCRASIRHAFHDALPRTTKGTVADGLIANAVQRLLSLRVESAQSVVDH